MLSSGQNCLRRFVNRTSRPSTFRMTLSTFVGIVMGSITVLLLLQAPLEQQRPHGEASTHRDHQQQIAALQALVINGVTQRQWDRGGSGVTESLDVDHDL